MCKELDDKMQEHTDAMNAGRMMELELLRAEIQYEDYDTVDQVKGAISSRIESLNDKAVKQYEADAKADHLTGNIPNV